MPAHHTTILSSTNPHHAQHLWNSTLHPPHTLRTSTPLPPMPPDFIPPPRRSKFLLLIAKWTGWLDTSPDDEDGGQRHAYTLAIRPDEPIAVGRLVKILAVSQAARDTPKAPFDDYDTYEPHILGRVAEIWRDEEGLARAKITNGCEGNRVVEVELTFPQLLAARPRSMGRATWKWSAAELVEMDLASPTRVRPALMERPCTGAGCWLDEPMIYISD